MLRNGGNGKCPPNLESILIPKNEAGSSIIINGWVYSKGSLSTGWGQVWTDNDLEASAAALFTTEGTLEQFYS